MGTGRRMCLSELKELNARAFSQLNFRASVTLMLRDV